MLYVYDGRAFDCVNCHHREFYQNFQESNGCRFAQGRGWQLLDLNDTLLHKKARKFWCSNGTNVDLVYTLTKNKVNRCLFCYVRLCFIRVRLIDSEKKLVSLS